MSKSLRFRLRAAIFSWPMLASIIVGVFLLLWNQIYYWILYCISYEPIPLSAMCTTFLDSIFRANDLGGFGIFATILAVLPASTLFCEDYNSGYCKAILCRVERKRYLRETLLCSGISGGLAVFLPVLLSDIVWIIMVSRTPGSRWESTILQSLMELYMGNYSLSGTAFFWCCSYFCWPFCSAHPGP